MNFYKNPRSARASRSVVDLAGLCEEVLSSQLRRVDKEAGTVQVPQLRDYVMELPGLHFHFNPTLVIGLTGASRLEFSHERLDVTPNSLVLIPGGIPHREIPAPAGREPAFENLAISVYNQTVSIELQACRHRSLKTTTEYYDTAKYQFLAQYLEDIAELSHDEPASHQLGIKGLLLSYLSTVQIIIRRSRQSVPVEKLKISQAKRLVHEHLGNCSLSVRFLADSLHCSGDYLSNLFHRETNQRLISFINRERVVAATMMLRTTPLTIAEIAYAVGFESQGYFSRVFKQITLMNPVAYRKSLERSVVELEGRPRTIYAAPTRTGAGM